MDLLFLKGLSYEIDFENVDKIWQIFFALVRVAAAFKFFGAMKIYWNLSHETVLVK